METTVERRVRIPMRDGTVLTATVHRTAHPRPAVLVRNPYGEPMTRSIPVVPFLDAGFAVVVSDCRGCGDADGEFVPFVHERADSADTLAWLSDQRWCTGEVVTYGASYSGMVQLELAVQAPAALKAMIPVVTPADYLTGVAYRGGAFQLGQQTGWHTLKGVQTLQHRAARGADVRAGFAALAGHGADPLATMSHADLPSMPWVSEVLPSWREWTTRPFRDEYWSELSYRDLRDRVDCPALHVGGWWDLFLGGTIDNFTTLRASAASEYARAGQRLVIGPWSHVDQSGAVGELFYGASAASAALGLERIEAEFLRAAVAGDPIPGPAVRVFVQGAGCWREAEEWPLPGTAFTEWHLHEHGVLATPSPTDDGAPSVLVFDPSDPTPTVGGQTLMTGGRDGGGEWAPGPRDQRAVEARPDVLSFTSAVLDTPVEVTGPVSARISVSTGGNDADVVVRLVDVHPDGRAIGVVAGVARLSARDGQDGPPSPVRPDEVYEVAVDMWATSQLFPAGHRIRIDVAGGSFPEWDRATGEPVTITVHHDRSHPSHVLLPQFDPDS